MILQNVMAIIFVSRVTHIFLGTPEIGHRLQNQIYKSRRETDQDAEHRQLITNCTRIIPGTGNTDFQTVVYLIRGNSAI